MIKGLYYRYQPNGLAVISVASGWSSFHRFLAELCCSKTLEWCRNPVAASGRSLWALTLRNKGKGEGQKLWIKKEHKKMPLKKKSQITNKNFEKYNASFLQVQPLSQPVQNSCNYQFLEASPDNFILSLQIQKFLYCEGQMTTLE